MRGGDAKTRLKLLRLRARLSQQQLADKAGVDPGTISLLESGRRPYERVSYGKIALIARALKVRCDDLFPAPTQRLPDGRGGHPRPHSAEYSQRHRESRLKGDLRRLLARVREQESETQAG